MCLLAVLVRGRPDGLHPRVSGRAVRAAGQGEPDRTGSVQAQRVTRWLRFTPKVFGGDQETTLRGPSVKSGSPRPGQRDTTLAAVRGPGWRKSTPAAETAVQ